MSVKDSNLIVNVQDGLKGDIVDIITFDDIFTKNDIHSLPINTDITFGEYLLFTSILKLLGDKKDIIIKLGYKD